MDYSDEKDWLAFCRNEPQAFDRIYRRHKDGLYDFCLYVTGDGRLSEDLVADVFTRLIRMKNKLEIESSLKNWLFICVRNMAYNLIRKRNREYNLMSQIKFNQEAVDIELKVFIEDILSRLDADERELILLRERQGFTIRELAEIVNISEEAVRTRLYRIRKKMQMLGKKA